MSRPTIGHDLPNTTRSVWCPKCGSDGLYFNETDRDLAFNAGLAPLRARCENPDCRVETFSTVVR